MRRSLIADRIATATLWAVALTVLALLGAIIVRLITEAAGELNPSFVFGDPAFMELGGVGPLLWNSVYMLVLSMLFTVPLGVAAGIYMAEYAGTNRVTDAIRFAEEAMSSVPSIVVGLFGLIAFVHLLGWGFSALAGACALTVFNLPLMARLAEQAIRGVPDVERQGSLALGATKWQTIRHVVLPLAIPAIATGVILTAGRVFGEAAALLFTAGVSTPGHYDFANLNPLDPASPFSPFRPATTLSVYVWKTNSEGLGPFVQQIADGASAVLLICVLVFNLGARLVSRLLVRRITAA